MTQPPAAAVNPEMSCLRTEAPSESLLLAPVVEVALAFGVALSAGGDSGAAEMLTVCSLGLSCTVLGILWSSVLILNPVSCEFLFWGIIQNQLLLPTIQSPKDNSSQSVCEISR